MLLFSQIIISVLIADFISGLGHWIEDTYGKPDWPLIGKYIVQPNIEHHHTPRSFLGRSYWSRNNASIILALIITTIVGIFGAITWQFLMIVFLLSQVNEIHAFTHRKPTEIPKWVRMLQEIGLMQSRRQHGEHHQSPFEVRFCILTNFLNPILDSCRFWWVLEWILLNVFRLPTQRGTEVRNAQ